MNWNFGFNIEINDMIMLLLFVYSVFWIVEESSIEIVIFVMLMTIQKSNNQYHNFIDCLNWSTMGNLCQVHTEDPTIYNSAERPISSTMSIACLIKIIPKTKELMK